MIEIDDKDLDRAAKMLEAFPGAIDKVSKKAVRAAVKGVKREAIDKITERYTIQKSRVGGTMRVSYQGAGAVFSSRGPVNDLSYFKHNPRSVPKYRPPKGKYLYSQVVKGQGGTIAHAFLARMRSGHVGVFSACWSRRIECITANREDGRAVDAADVGDQPSRATWRGG
mgnify:CR=1 FL=1